MKQTRAQLEQRRRHLRAKIAAERMLFEQQLEGLRGPAAVIDKALAAGTLVRQNAPLIALAASAAMFLSRGRLLSSVTGGVRLSRRVMKMLTLWKFVAAFLRRHPPRRSAGPFWHRSSLA
jgi:hypothetical protein